MYWQTERIRTAAALAVGSTYRLTLPDSGFLSALMLYISGDQVSGVFDDGGLWRIVDHITKVEVVANGSTVVKDLTGQLVQALAFYDQGRPALDTWRNYASNTQMCSLLLNFGRWLHDPDYGLDLSKYDNVELRITTDATVAMFASGFAVNIDAIWLRPAAQARSMGFLRAEVWRQWTTVSDEWQYLELPSENIIRRIVLQAIPAYDSTTKAADTQFTNVIYDVQHKLKTGEVNVFDGRMADLARINAYDYGGYLILPGHVYLNADKAVPFGVGVPQAKVFTVGSYSGAVETVIATLEAGQTADTIRFENGMGAGPDEGLAIGYGYHNTAVLRHDVDSDPLTWLDPAGMRTVLLNLHTRSSSSADDGTARVVLDRLVRY